MKLKEWVKVEDYQWEGVNWLVKQKMGVLADEMGLGKSLQALIAANKVGKQIGVICPGGLRHNWVKEVYKFFDDVTVGAVHNNKDLDKLTFDEDVIIISYEFVEKAMFLFTFLDTWILDEVQKIKNEKSKRTQWFTGAMHSFCPPKQVFMLTGTPIANRVPDLYVPLYICSVGTNHGIDIRKAFKSQQQFGYYFCENIKRTIRINGKVKGKKYHRGGRTREVTTLGKLKKHKAPQLHSLMEGRLLRRLAKDYLNLEELQYKPHIINDSINKELEEAYQNRSKVSSMERKENNALRKCKHTAHYINNLVEEVEGPILVFTDHVDSSIRLGELVSYMGLKTGIINGRVSDKIRQKYVDSFTTGELDILVATYGTCSTGYTFVNCNHIVKNDYSWNPDDNDQAVKRIHRKGQEKPCYVHQILSDASDVRILELVSEKKEDIDIVLKEQ